MTPAHPALLSTFADWHRRNRRGGWAARFKRLPTWRAQLLQRLGYEHEVEAPLFFGGSMRVITCEALSRGLLAFGYSEVALTALMLYFLKPGQHFVDVGTHFGYESLLGVKLVGDGGHVTAFEPCPSTYRIAAINLPPPVELHNAAASDTPGTLRLTELPRRESAFNGAAAQGAPSVEVRAVRLDDAISRPVHFLKVDVEGHEMAVLRGAQRILRESRPVIVLEADMPIDGKPSARAFEQAEYLTGFGYSAYSFEFDGELQWGPLGTIEAGHANTAFLPQ